MVRARGLNEAEKYPIISKTENGISLQDVMRKLGGLVDNVKRVLKDRSPRTPSIDPIMLKNVTLHDLTKIRRQLSGTPGYISKYISISETRLPEVPKTSRN